MPIASQDIADQMRFALDAEGSDHYSDTLDIIPAINASVRWVVGVINVALGEKKISEESLSDVSIARVMQTSKDSRIEIESIPDDVWTILAIYPLPETDVTGNPAVLQPDEKVSVHRDDLYHISSNFDAGRLTIEEWNKNKNNPFAAGNVVVDSECPDIIDYGYLNPIKYFKDGQATSAKDIEIRPYINKGLATVVYAKSPTNINNLTDDIELPESVFQVVFNKALQYIAYKQGDGTNLDDITTKDVQMLIQTIM
jgi:hypothetical protein